MCIFIYIYYICKNNVSNTRKLLDQFYYYDGLTVLCYAVR